MSDLSVLRSMPVLLVEAKLLLNGGTLLGFASPDAEDSGASGAASPSSPVMSPGSLAGGDPGPVPSANQETFAGNPGPQSAPFLAGLRMPYPQAFGGTRDDSAASAGPGQGPVFVRAAPGSDASLAVVEAGHGSSGDTASSTVTGSPVPLIASKDQTPGIDTRTETGTSSESMLEPPGATPGTTSATRPDTRAAPSIPDGTIETDVAPSGSAPVEAASSARTGPSVKTTDAMGSGSTTASGPIPVSSPSSDLPPDGVPIDPVARSDAEPNPLAGSGAAVGGSRATGQGAEAPSGPAGADAPSAPAGANALTATQTLAASGASSVASGSIGASDPNDLTLTGVPVTAFQSVSLFDAEPYPLTGSGAAADVLSATGQGSEAPLALAGAPLALPADVQMSAGAPGPNPDGGSAVRVAEGLAASEVPLVARSSHDERNGQDDSVHGRSGVDAPRQDDRDGLANAQDGDKLTLHNSALRADVSVGRRNPADNIDVWSRDILAQLASGDAQVATGIIPSFILNAAMIPGWPPPRPFEMPSPGQLTRLLANDPRNEAALLKALTERGGASLIARLRKLLKRLTRSKRLKMLLGLTALMTTIEATIEAIEAELLELSRLHAAQDDLAFETALQRRHLSA